VIDFQNTAFVKLGYWDLQQARAELEPILSQDEQLFLAFKGMRDSIVFTSKRIVTVNVQGITEKKKDYSSLPYARIHAFSTETAGFFDRDCELDVWFSGLGHIRLEFSAGVDIRGVGKLLADKAL